MMKIHNTLTQQLEEVVPLEGNRIRLYTCGPTVYNYAHIGNFRAYIFEDLLRRCIKYFGFEVVQVMNLTDVDDKTIAGAIKAGVSLDAFTKIFKVAFFEDLKGLNVEPAEHYPAATDHIPEMIDIIKKLMDKGHAYQSEDGSIYFSVSSFPGYGKLAHLDMAGLRPGARVHQDEYEKENVADFALWKAWDAKDGDVVWDAPWGRGRPGWHIECSAMATKYLGESFDMHTGGVDNVFPHHEDEIAQSEAASGKPYVRYWLHCAHLIVDGRKMSKSLGNFYTIRDVISKGYSGREVRYVLMAGHYRQSLNFSFDALVAARNALQRLDEFQDRLKELAGDLRVPCELPDWAVILKAKFDAGLADDLNISESLGALFDLVHAGNRAIDAKTLTREQAAVIVDMLLKLDAVLGFLTKPAEAIPIEAINLLALRQQARQSKNWPEADRVRNELATIGWVIQDTPQGPKLKRK
ncbi:MAG: cysteine--tRNA ligase [bacterium]|jgi:cysteinyl-tRNA synthetase